MVCTALTSFSLFGEETHLKFGPTTLSLPGGWTVMGSCKDAGSVGPVDSSLDTNAMTLLLTARHSDAARKIGISLFRSNFRSDGPHPLSPGDEGEKAEAEKLLCMVYGLGFEPTNIKTSRTDSSQNAPMLTVEVTATNSGGEQRIFTDTVTGNNIPVVRLFTSRQAWDSAAEKDVAAIIKSLEVAGNSRANPSASGSSQKSANAPTPTPTPSSTQSAQIVSDYHEALLMVEGQRGGGSGFICKLGDHAVAVTNIHVIAGNPGFKVTDLKSTALKVESGAVAVEHDIAKLEVKTSAKSFELMQDLDTNVKIGDPVMVLGNAQGAHVVKPVEGKVVGIGPNLVEVDAPFVPGNSGSPIIHTATGKVLGIATYLLERKQNKSGKGFTVETRRFGYRLDSVKTWEPLDWQRFYAQAAQLEKIDALSSDFVRLFREDTVQDAITKHRASEFQNQGMQYIFRSLAQRADVGKRGSGGQGIMVREFLNNLRSLSRSDLGSFNTNAAYDYFRREHAEQVTFRNAAYADLTQLIDSIASH